ncbi:MAG TPA: phospholipase A [Candidatus Paceibacterota bacterium]|nr:phospholipase A [Candidatus Paceibacterota bacterium]
MGTHFSGRRWLRAATIFFCSIWLTVHGKELTLTVSGGDVQPVAGEEGGFWLNALNTTGEKISWVAPSELKCRLTSKLNSFDISAHLPDASGEPVALNAGTFARREYVFTVPEKCVGETTLEIQSPDGTRLALKLEALAPKAVNSPEKKGMVYFLKGRQHAKEAGQYDPDTFFKQHIFGYDPFYFIAGTQSPNAKFQLSFKYRLLNDSGWLAQKAPWTLGFHMAYSQTSLWDWNADSAPFFDSSYRPEFLYSWDRVVGGGADDWFRLDLQGGLQHESNGRDGDRSRSMNITYLRPRVTFGYDSGLQLTLTPRVWYYVGDLSDNPDIANYRGYADLRAALGWKRGLQISALGRIGNHLSHGGVALDVTYPLMQPPNGSFSLYLQAQYFTGYGESLIGYRDRTDIFRAGISLYR